MIRINCCYDAIQGEGVNQGRPMVILRLQGCGVGCPWCDTKETWDPKGGEAVEEQAAVDMVRSLAPKGWVLVTGGEPADQDLGELVHQLHRAGYQAALETSGTAQFTAPFDWVCVSPKVGMPGGRKVRPDVVAEADEIKWVIGKPVDVANFKRFLAAYPRKKSAALLLQPVSLSPKATQVCVTALREHREWRLSLQTHKYIGQP